MVGSTRQGCRERMWEDFGFLGFSIKSGKTLTSFLAFLTGTNSFVGGFSAQPLDTSQVTPVCYQCVLASVPFIIVY